MLTQGAAKYPITEVCLHTSATAETWYQGKTVEAMRDEIRRWHVHDRHWRDIGYHFVVAPDGSWATGRQMNVIGAGVEGHNRGVVHICMVPVVEVTKIGRFENWYTAAQKSAVRQIIAGIRKNTGAMRVTGHNDFANKLCPGFKVAAKDWL